MKQVNLKYMQFNVHVEISLKIIRCTTLLCFITNISHGLGNYVLSVHLTLHRYTIESSIFSKDNKICKCKVYTRITYQLIF